MFNHVLQCFKAAVVIEAAFLMGPETFQRRGSVAPRAADGKPDFSGIWMAGNTNCARGGNSIALNCGAELPLGREGINFGVSLPGANTIPRATR